MSDIGNSLREARIRRGLTIKDVEDVTKIRSKYLEALEENDYEVLPGSTYAKAFLRTYASFLKLDADELLQDYRDRPEVRREDSVVRNEVVQKSRSQTSAERKKQRVRRSQRGYLIVGVLAVIAIFLLAWFGSGRGQDDSVALDSSSFSSATNTTGGPTTTAAPEAAVSSTTTVSVTGENVALVVTVTERSCWLVVREDNQDGAELFAGTLSAGGQKTFDSAKRYWMNVGDPTVLALSINGVPHTLDGGSDSFMFVVTEAGVETSE